MSPGIKEVHVVKRRWSLTRRLFIFIRYFPQCVQLGSDLKSLAVIPF